MARKDPPQPLSPQTNSANNNNPIGRGPQSATSLKSPTSPRPFFGKSHSKSSENIRQHKPQGPQPQLPYPETSMMPASTDVEMSQPGLGNQPKASTPPAQNSPQKNSFFGFNKSKSSNKLQQNETRRPATRDQLQSRDNNDFQLQQSATTGDMKADNRLKDVGPQAYERNLIQTKTEPQLSRLGAIESYESRPTQTPNHTVAPKKSKPKGFGLLRRTNSTRNDLDSMDDGRQLSVQEQEYQEGIRTAPIREDQDLNYREALKDSNNRAQSADRQRHEKPEQKTEYGRRMKDSHRQNSGSVSLPREASSSLMNHIKGAGSKAANRIFGSSKSSDKDTRAYIQPEQFVPRLVNLPLIEQTRATRISKRLETSRDRTEYWMPSLPWRCIDYLNVKGLNQEGLYRIPGANKEILKYQEKFDTETDVDLLNGVRDLYDCNIIGSLLKMWLRELPDEIFPKEAQNRIAKAAGHEPEPTQSVIEVVQDELSKLPPYNYFLLFALTCHLSLILKNCEQNKMTMSNLTICILPCMKMDATCFKLLVKHWELCWETLDKKKRDELFPNKKVFAGCASEDLWLSKEKDWREGEEADLRDPGPLGMRKASVAQSERSAHERNLSSNSDSRPATAAAANERSRDVSRENNNAGRQASERYNTGSKNANGSGNSSRERQLPMNLRGGNGNERDITRLQTPPEAYVAPGSNGRHDQLLEPIQPMSPMHMPDARQG